MDLTGLERLVPCSTSALDRLATGRDLWPRTTLQLAHGTAPAMPLAVAWPRTAEEVFACLAWATRAGVPVVPYGAGSGVCGAAEGRADAISLDLKRLVGIGRVDPDRRVVRTGAGVLGQHLEDELERQGWATRHSPSSIWCSTVGGWAAGRSAGQFSSRYGKFEDMVTAARVVSPSGTWGIGGWAEGEDLGPWVLGSEGALGVLTEIEVRVVPFPTRRWLRGYRFGSVADALGAMRAVMQGELHPSVLRLYDPADTRIAGKGTATKEKGAGWLAALAREADRVPALRAHLLSLPLSVPRLLNSLLDAASSDCVLLAGWEGTDDVVDLCAGAGHAAILGAGGADMGAEPGEHWYAHRHEVSYKLAPIFARGGFADTMEVAATWSRIPALYAGVREAIGRHGVVMAHFSHAYAEGCSIYFTFAGTGEIGVYDALWHDALAAAAAAGATVAHHHGVGQLKRDAAARELAGLGDTFRALKARLDPAGVLNPGRMFPPMAVPEAPRPETGIDEVSRVATLDAQEPAGERDAWLAARGWVLRHPTRRPLAFPVPRRPWECGVLGCSVFLDGRRVVLPAVPRSSAGPDPRAAFPADAYETVTVPVVPQGGVVVTRDAESLVRRDIRPTRDLGDHVELHGLAAEALAARGH